MPIAEHPFDGSWGYQVTGFYAPTHRFGAPGGLRLVRGPPPPARNRRHPRLGARPFSQGRFRARRIRRDRTSTSTPTRGRARTWTGARSSSTTAGNEVRCFLVANALAWFERYHVDGLRVDAVASMLYLDYSRGHGEWVPNRYGGRENLEAIDFLRARERPGAPLQSGRPHDRRGEHLVPERHPPDLRGGPRVRLQVEHGLDARHPEVLLQGAHPPTLAPERPDVRDALPVRRELRLGLLARRGGPRQGVDALQDGGLAHPGEGGEPARALRAHVGLSRQEAPVHGRASSPSRGSGTTRPASTGTCASTWTTRACAGSWAT